MSLLRYGHDAYGEPVLNGICAEMYAVAFAAGVAVIIVHLIWRALRRGKGA